MNEIPRAKELMIFCLQLSGKLFEMTSFSTSTSYSLSWNEDGLKASDMEMPPYPETYDPLNKRVFNPVDPHFNTQPIQKLDSPFSFSIDFSYRWTLNPNGSNDTRATINARNIRMKLTPKWDFQTEIGYDLIRHELTPSQFYLHRNMCCWDLSFTMNPFGDNKYFFSLSISSGQIQSLIQKLPLLNNFKGRLSSTGRGVPPGF